MLGYEVKIRKDQILELKNGHLLVDGKQFTVTFPKELIIGVEDNKLVTVYSSNFINYWDCDEIEGHYT